MAWLLARFQEQHGCSRSQLAARLGLPLGRLPRLALCLRPRPDHWADDVAAIAARVGCSPTALADLVRQATADEPSNGSPAPSPSRAP